MRGFWRAYPAVLALLWVRCDLEEPTAPGPDPEEISRTLGVKVTMIPDEVRQYLVYAPQGSVDFSRLGKVHTDLGYAVGVTLEDDVQVGFRFASPDSAVETSIEPPSSP